MAITLAFDVYGTLIDTQGMVTALRPILGDRAEAFSLAWREKQLEYSFRRGLMRNYVPFSTCTEQALDFTCEARQVALSPQDRNALLEAYRALPAFPEAAAGLTRARERGLRTFAFSNGTVEAVTTLLDHAGLLPLLDGVVSVEDQRSFKPDPGVYAHFLRQAGAAGAAAWMVSGNPFDILGAASAGLRTAWIRRSATQPFDPWGIAPDLVLPDLGDLGDRIEERR